MIAKSVYDKLKDTYKDVASWALWSPVGASPASHTGDMSVFDDPKLLDLIHNNYVLVALNASVHAERNDGYTGPWRMFHSDDNKRQRDFKLRHAIVDTAFEGAYMTDIIKNHPDKDSAQVMKHCRDNPQTIIDNVEAFRDELATLGGTPIIVAMGGNTRDILNKSTLNDDYEVVTIHHYSAQNVKKDDLRQQVLDITNKGELLT